MAMLMTDWRRSAVYSKLNLELSVSRLRKFAILLLFVIAVAPKISSAMAAGSFVQTSCRSGFCVWSSIKDQITISKLENGNLIGASFQVCIEKNGKYPNNYRCQTSKIQTSESVAFCSRLFPSIASKNEKGKWERTRLSISDDGEYGYNREAITNYLRICHGYVRGIVGVPSLDTIGAKFGYKSRYQALGANEHDAVEHILDLPE